MFRSIFNPDNVVFRAINRFGQIWLLNMLWVLCSLPVFTIGASTTALIYACLKLRKEEGYVTQNFFHSFKENLKQSTILWLLYLAVGVLAGVALVFWNNTDIPGKELAWAATLLVLILYGVSLLYVFALQSRFYNTVRNTVKFSFLLAYRNLVETFLMALIAVAFVLINVFGVFLINFISLNFGVAFVVYLLSAHYEKIFSIYIEKKEEPDIVTE